jgi:hypothetical protein
MLHVFGDSHVSPLHRGKQTLNDEMAGAGIDADFYVRQAPNWRNVRITQVGKSLKLRGLCTWEKPLAYTIDKPDDIYVFSAPLHTAGLWRELAWREFCPWRVAAQFPRHHPVSDAVIEHMAEQHADKTLEILRQIKARGYMILVAEPPKPLKKGPQVDAIEPGVVIAVDQVYRRYIAGRLSDFGIPIIPIPDFTHEDGLTPDLYADARPDDTHHGSTEFGRVMMKQIVRLTMGITLN